MDLEEHMLRQASPGSWATGLGVAHSGPISAAAHASLSDCHGSLSVGRERVVVQTLLLRQRRGDRILRSRDKRIGVRPVEVFFADEHHSSCLCRKQLRSWGASVGLIPTYWPEISQNPIFSSREMYATRELQIQFKVGRRY